MKIILGIACYLVIGILSALIICFKLLNEDDLPDEKSEVNAVIITCVIFWIIIIPGIVYNNLKGGNNNG